jgi:CheY-like chemotaxis protein
VLPFIGQQQSTHNSRKASIMANILVVDDEMGIRELLSEILGDEGHVVTTAQNAQEARDLLKSRSPDLILCHPTQRVATR